MDNKILTALVASTLCSLDDMGDEITPLIGIYLALQMKGFSTDVYTLMIAVGLKAKLWTTTNDTISITEKGRALSRKLQGSMVLDGTHPSQLN